MDIDGVLYSKDGKVLISYPIDSEREEYSVLDSVEEIQTYSISGAKNLKKTLYQGRRNKFKLWFTIFVWKSRRNTFAKKFKEN